MAKVYVVYYDEVYPGYGDDGNTEQRQIHGVYASAESARVEINRLRRIGYACAGLEEFEVQQ
jgi:hypothetical protein